MPSFFSVLDSNSFIRYGKYCRVLPQVSCSLVCRRCSNCSVVCLGRLGLPWCPVLGVALFGYFVRERFFGSFVAIREFYSGLATPPQSLSGSSIQKKQRFPGNLEIGCIRSTQGKTQDTGVVDENMTATVLSSALPARARGAPASTSGTTPRRRLRAALARRGGSTSTSSSLKDPPPKEVFQGAVWRVDRGR